MTLLDASPVNKARIRRRRMIIAAIVIIAILIIAGLLYWPYYSARTTATHFMDALVQHNYQKAYFLWQANPRDYTMDRFMQDWGPGSPWGTIRTYRVLKVENPPGGHSSGFVATIEINGMHDTAQVWVEKKNHAMSFYLSPF